MSKFGKKQIQIKLKNAIKIIPKNLSKYSLKKNSTGNQLIYSYNSENSVDNLLFDLTQTGLKYKDLEIKQKNLEEIFLSLVKNES